MGPNDTIHSRKPPARSPGTPHLASVLAAALLINGYRTQQGTNASIVQLGGDGHQPDGVSQCLMNRKQLQVGNSPGAQSGSPSCMRMKTLRSIATHVVSTMGAKRRMRYCFSVNAPLKRRSPYAK
mmetsp:Transcript_37636/g.82614  ORF Transcript_37636/g.82614 Transcript_37636/m.82614 type:complete len:125 (-) Transcript_37636:208-582(-)